MPPSNPDHNHPSSSLPTPFMTAVTGGIGSGKSTIAKEFEKLGAHRIDADEVAGKILERAEILNELSQIWGKDVTDSHGGANRALISSIVFSDHAARKILESLVHPEVRSRIDDALAKLSTIGFDKNSPLPEGRVWILLDIPLLETSPYRNKVDRILFVDAPDSDRETRVVQNRGWQPGERSRRESAQFSLKDKKAGASDVIQNANGLSDEERIAHCQAVLDRWIQDLTNPSPEN